MPDLLITDDLLDRCAYALFAVDCRTVRPDQSTPTETWRAMTDTARQAYRARARAVLAEALT